MVFGGDLSNQYMSCEETEQNRTEQNVVLYCRYKTPQGNITVEGNKCLITVVVTRDKTKPSHNSMKTIQPKGANKALPYPQ